MEKFIIKYRMKVDGKWSTKFHQDITPTPDRLKAMNVYTENITAVRKEAKVFYDIGEAKGICHLFDSPLRNGEVISLIKKEEVQEPAYIQILSDDQLWKIIKRCQWEKDHNYKRIKEFLEKNYSKSMQTDIAMFVFEKQEELNVIFGKKRGINVSDDGWSDLRAEVIGRGREFYNNISAKQLRKMANSLDYHESFYYAIMDFLPEV